MGNQRKCAMALKSPKFGKLIFRCQYPTCCNFFTSTTYNGLKYCFIHPHIPSRRGNSINHDRSRA